MTVQFACMVRPRRLWTLLDGVTPLLRKLVLGKGSTEDRQVGLQGNHVLLSTWTKCFCEFWYGDALPNSDRPRKLTFEQLFLALIDREELEYQLDTDEEPYTAPSQSRFDTPEFVIVAGDTLRRLQMMRGSRVAFRRRGYQKDVAEIAKVTTFDGCCR